MRKTFGIVGAAPVLALSATPTLADKAFDRMMAGAELDPDQLHGNLKR